MVTRTAEASRVGAILPVIGFSKRNRQLRNNLSSKRKELIWEPSSCSLTR